MYAILQRLDNIENVLYSATYRSTNTPSPPPPPPPPPLLVKKTPNWREKEKNKQIFLGGYEAIIKSLSNLSSSLRELEDELKKGKNIASLHRSMRTIYPDVYTINSVLHNLKRSVASGSDREKELIDYFQNSKDLLCPQVGEILKHVQHLISRLQCICDNTRTLFEGGNAIQDGVIEFWHSSLDFFEKTIQELEKLKFLNTYNNQDLCRNLQTVTDIPCTLMSD